MEEFKEKDALRRAVAERVNGASRRLCFQPYGCFRRGDSSSLMATFLLVWGGSVVTRPIRARTHIRSFFATNE